MVKIVVEQTVAWGETVKLLQAQRLAHLLALASGCLQCVVQEQMETSDSQDKHW